MNSDLELYNAMTGEVILNFSNIYPLAPIMDIAFSPFGNLIATAHVNSFINLWAVIKDAGGL